MKKVISSEECDSLIRHDNWDKEIQDWENAALQRAEPHIYSVLIPSSENF